MGKHDNTRAGPYLWDRYGPVRRHTPERTAALSMFATDWVHGRLPLWSSNPVTEDSTRAMSRIDLADFPRTAASLPVEDEEWSRWCGWPSRNRRGLHRPRLASTPDESRCRASTMATRHGEIAPSKAQAGTSRRWMWGRVPRF